jgi:7,8-dihydropterin-6-yl-methyl-4-(beta-D-ribofuranosyl)aminobenzene 5'-phosphate synthase
MTKMDIPLVEVDEVKITIIMDNTVDFLMASTEIAHRNLSSNRTRLRAEHGFSALIQVKCGDKKGAILLDAGISFNGTLNNIDMAGIDLDDIQAVVLSHGHFDHTLGLPGLIEMLGSQKFCLVFHPDAYLERKIVMPDGNELNISPPNISELRRENITFFEKKDPTLLIDDMILVSGEIIRTTDFEKGFPLHYSKRNGEWEYDPLIKDDQCVVINVRGKGLVIITGCSHSGVINTIRYAQTLTNIRRVHAVVGGFHLTGSIFEKNIPDTVAELQKINPAYLMPGHCTGWSAIHQIANSMPEAFIPNNVGTTLVFKAAE